MIYGYIRVSTDKQTVENQRFEINNFCKKENLKIDCWIEETVSGCINPEQRKLGEYLDRFKRNDIIICSEVSRLGRNLLMVMSLLHNCFRKGVEIWSIKENSNLKDDLYSTIIAFTFGLTAEMERRLISQRTKEALNRKRMEGVILGRPKGRKSKKVLLSDKKEIIEKMLLNNESIVHIAKTLGVHRHTVRRFIKRENIEIKNVKYLNHIS